MTSIHLHFDNKANMLRGYPLDVHTYLFEHQDSMFVYTRVVIMLKVALGNYFRVLFPSCVFACLMISDVRTAIIPRQLNHLCCNMKRLLYLNQNLYLCMEIDCRFITYKKRDRVLKAV